MQIGFVLDVVLAPEKERVGAGVPQKTLPPIRKAQPSQTAFLQIGQIGSAKASSESHTPQWSARPAMRRV